MPGLVSYVSRDYRYHFTNRLYAEWFNRPNHEIDGKPVWEVLGQAHFEIVRPYMERALNGEVVVFETSHSQKGDQLRHVRATYVPDKSVDGLVQGFAVLVEDITEQKQARDVIRQNEQRYRQIVETAAEGIWTIDEHGNTSFVNERLAQMIGYRVEEILGRNAFDFVFEEDRAEALCKFVESRQGPARPYDFRLCRKNGVPFG